MDASTSQEIHQTPTTNRPPSLAVTADNVDCERGAPSGVGATLWSLFMKCPLMMTFLLSLIIMMERCWPFPGLLDDLGCGTVACLDKVCPQVDSALTPGHEALLESLDEEFGSTGFKLEAYESLGGAVRIP